MSLIIMPGLTINAATENDAFLDKVQRDSLRYFTGEMNPANGLVKDSSRPGAPASVAAVGFGIAATCVGHSRGWITKDEAYERIVKTLTTFRDKVPHERGFFYHFLDMRTGNRAWNSEVSSIDTALFLAGALFAGEYFKGTEVEKIADELYERVDWQWMMNNRKVLCMGWKPEEGFLWYYWDSYSEAMVLYALAIGSPTHPIPAVAWREWKRYTDSYAGYPVVYCPTGSIFTYQYSHAFIDFRRFLDPSTLRLRSGSNPEHLSKDSARPESIDGLAQGQSPAMAIQRAEMRHGIDGGINYYSNSVMASKANRQFCIDNAEKYTTYGENSWGLTASLGPDGYKGYGAKPGEALHDGTIAPCGMAGSAVFNREDAIRGLKYLYDTYGSFMYGPYGFKDAFNMSRNWWAEEYLGIDVGITILMLENARSELVWNKFMQIKPIKSWLEKIV